MKYNTVKELIHENYGKKEEKEGSNIMLSIDSD